MAIPYTLATLPAAASRRPGTQLWTTDAGMQTSDGVRWSGAGGSRIWNSMAMLGDSRPAQMYADVGQLIFQGRHYLVQANSLNGNRLRIVYNGAVSGQRSDQYLSQLPQAIASNAKHVHIHGVINDIDAGRTIDQIWPAIRDAARLIAAGGQYCTLVSETGISTFTSTQQGYVHQYNQRCRQLAESTSGILFFDISSSLMDPAQSTLNFKAGFSNDPPHPNATGGFASGQAWNDQFGHLFAALQQRVATGSEVGAKGGVQLFTNPTFIQATGATFGGANPPTGAGPATWFCDSPNEADVTSSVEGQEWVLEIEASAACTVPIYFYLVPTGDGANYPKPAVGDRFQLGAEIAVEAGSANYVGPQCRMLLQLPVDRNFQIADCFTPAGDGPGPASAYVKTLASPVLTVPEFSGDPTAWYCYFDQIFSGAGSATIRLQRPWLHKLIAE